MKKSFIKFLAPLAFSIATLSGCITPGTKVLTNIESFYASVNLSEDNYNIFKDLHRLMWQKHTNHISYASFNNFLDSNNDWTGIDKVPGTNKNEMIYTGHQTTGKGNREHVWPCAKSKGLWVHDSSAGEKYVDGSNYWGGGSDLLHIRPCTSAVNTLRGDAEFVDFDDEEYNNITPDVYSSFDSGKAVKATGGTLKNGVMTFAAKFEVDDSMKGDIARILAYVWLHYSQCSATPTEYKSKTGLLSFVSVLGYPDEWRCAEKLMEWNELDSVSDIERARNDNVQKIQGNRNPFVDFPDLLPVVLYNNITQ